MICSALDPAARACSQVQKELQALKARANEAEMQLKRNDKLKSLEDEKEWYRKEVRLAP